MKLVSILLLIIGVLIAVGASAQSPDSFIVENGSALPGDTILVSIYLHNTQFSVAGFTMRFILLDSTYTSFIAVGRGSAVVDFDYFNANINSGTCRIAGIAALPGGNNPPLLPIGYHEMVRVSVVVSDSAPPGGLDSILFVDDLIPPDRDNSISDSTGYINEVPTLIGGMIIFETQSAIDDNPVGMPLKMELLQNYPNPFNGETQINFILAQNAENVNLDIFDLIGRVVKNFFWSNLTVGNHSVLWDGKNQYGETLSSGIYFYKLETNNAVADYKKMTFLK